jgi:hypothetical protein
MRAVNGGACHLPLDGTGIPSPLIMTAEIMLDHCVEKLRLAREYQMAASAFSAAVKELQQKIGTSPREEYARLDRVANDARVKCEYARLALEQHIAAHGC